MAASIQQVGSNPPAAYAEKHFSVQEIADLWGLHRDSITKIFKKEPGVLIIENNGFGRRKRRYQTLRIPESVLAWVHQRMARP